MNVRHRTGPGNLPVVDVALDAERWNLADEGGFAAAAPELARDAGLEYFVEEHLDKPDAPKLILVLDEPNRTGPRAAMAVALAAELIRWEKSVLVLDGDDHRPDLTRWADRLDSEGWVDVIRYGISLEAASIPLPFAPKKGRLLGVGSYQPTRISAEELTEFVARQGENYDHIIVSASTGDRGSVWASQPGLSLVCWTPGIQHESVVEGMVHDAGLLGGPPRAIMNLVGRPEGEAPVSAEELSAFDGAGGNSSPVFRRLAGLLAVLFVLLAVWWFGILKRGGDEEPGIAARDGVETVDQRTAAAAGEMMDEAGNAAGDVMDQAGATGDAVADRAETVAAAAADRVQDVAAQSVDRAGSVAGAAADAGRDVATGTRNVVTRGTESAAATAEEMRNAVRDVVSQDRASQDRTSQDKTPASHPFDAAAYGADVGADGWCLHLFSLRHQDVAEDMVRDLEKQDVHGRIVASMDDSGKYWYRVYVGSFADRNAARKAEAALMERLGIDYAAPKRAADIF